MDETKDDCGSFNADIAQRQMRYDRNTIGARGLNRRDGQTAGIINVCVRDDLSACVSELGFWLVLSAIIWIRRGEFVSWVAHDVLGSSWILWHQDLAVVTRNQQHQCTFHYLCVFSHYLIKQIVVVVRYCNC